MFKSKYLIKISYKNPTILLNRLVKYKIKFLKITISDDSLILLVDIDNYMKIKKIKTTAKIKIINRYGVSKYKYLFSKYVYFIGAIIISIFILKVLSSLILRIDVMHSSNYLKNIVLADLNKEGISKYKFKVSYKKRTQIVKKILAKERDLIEWMEIKEDGTTYKILLEERKKKIIKKNLEKQSVVAKKSGFITAIDASSGEIVKKVNDYVSKGETIISGVIMNKDKPVNIIRAEGTILAEVWYKVRVDYPYDYVEKNRTGRKCKRLEFYMFDKNITLFSPRYKDYEVIRKNVLSNRIIPIGINYNEYDEVKVKKVKNNKDILKKALAIANNKIKSKLGRKDKIIYEKTLKKVYKNSKIIVEVFFKVEEDITDYISLKDVLIEDIDNKEE